MKTDIDEKKIVLDLSKVVKCKLDDTIIRYFKISENSSNYDITIYSDDAQSQPAKKKVIKKASTSTKTKDTDCSTSNVCAIGLVCDGGSVVGIECPDKCISISESLSPYDLIQSCFETSTNNTSSAKSANSAELNKDCVENNECPNGYCIWYKSGVGKCKGNLLNRGDVCYDNIDCLSGICDYATGPTKIGLVNKSIL
jgi:hypothetical protein